MPFPKKSIDACEAKDCGDLGMIFLVQNPSEDVFSGILPLENDKTRFEMKFLLKLWERLKLALTPSVWYVLTIHFFIILEDEEGKVRGVHYICQEPYLSYTKKCEDVKDMKERGPSLSRQTMDELCEEVRKKFGFVETAKVVSKIADVKCLYGNH